MSFDQDREAPATDGRDYLQRRVREEAEAAIGASSVAATMIHIALATAYARRFGESIGGVPAHSWADDHRIW